MEKASMTGVPDTPGAQGPPQQRPSGTRTPDGDDSSERPLTLSVERSDGAVSRADRGFGDLLRAASRQCRNLVDSERARIWVVRRAGRRLVAFDFPRGEGRAPIERRLRSGEGAVGRAMASGEPLQIRTDDPREGLWTPAEAFSAALVVPMSRRGEIFAAVECLNKKGGGDFSAEDFQRLQDAAQQIGFALDNAMLYQATERRSLEKDLLLELSKMLGAPHDLDAVIEAILLALRHVVNYDAAAIYLVNSKTDKLELVNEVGHPDASAEVFEIQIGQGIVGWVAKTGEPVIVPDVRTDSRYVVSRSSTRSELAVPLVLEGRAIGVFNVESDMDDAYHEGHIAIVSGFAAQAAVAVQRAQLAREQLERRRFDKELAIAREIQLSFLPASAPEIPGFELAGTALPHAEVGGDYYDFIHVSQNRLGLAIADVSGKGIPAALIMAGFRMSLLAEIRNEFAIRAIMRKVNTLLHESIERHKFVTGFYGVLDYRNRVLIFSNAGHNPPILIRANGEIEYLVEGGVALGVLADAFYEERPIAIFPGDVLVLYTDGVSEAESPTGEQFERDRIEESTLRHASKSAQGIVDGLIEDVREWAGERGQVDDLTLMVVKALPE